MKNEGPLWLPPTLTCVELCAKKFQSGDSPCPCGAYSLSCTWAVRQYIMGHQAVIKLWRQTNLDKGIASDKGLIFNMLIAEAS